MMRRLARLLIKYGVAFYIIHDYIVLSPWLQNKTKHCCRHGYTWLHISISMATHWYLKV